jgi:hypothetical protein
MQQFIEKYRDEVTGVLSGFDRLVFRASPRRLNYGCFDKNLALSRNSSEGPFLRSFRYSVNGDEFDVGDCHPLGLQ